MPNQPSRSDVEKAMEIIKSCHSITKEDNEIAYLHSVKILYQLASSYLEQEKYCKCEEPITCDLESYALERCGRCGSLLQPKPSQGCGEQCKYAIISHGIGLDGNVSEIIVECKFNRDIKYRESIVAKPSISEEFPVIKSIVSSSLCEIVSALNQKIPEKLLNEMSNRYTDRIIVALNKEKKG